MPNEIPADLPQPDNEQDPVRDSAADVADGVIDAADAGSSFCNGFDGCGGFDGCSGFDGCDCGGCDCNLLLRVSTLLALAAVLVPARGGGALVRALLRGYQRWLSRFTPRCPATPSCSAYALAAVEELGPRRGLRAAAQRVQDCGRRP
ncbi:membrane protein insertion efficiency factor YidD [Pseudonocardia sp. GCM10023141]|uniref:membrane protein insertion efficiency factor YidD n=1 Tax=Pseudonocardia sp. GCM10023141 TaxID=3252653 RepID=UPI0036195AF4